MASGSVIEGLGLKRDLPAGTIDIANLTKRFRKHTLTKHGYTTVKSSLLGRFFRSRFPRDNYIQALNDVSLHLAPGSAVGVIGRNGSGKSTLLKLIAGIYRPDAGRVAVVGRISALIELGAGFHPDFTGRENVYLGGVMYGLSRKEIDARFDNIVAYAELEDFIDDPVRTYSSGMYMRLGFSLAIHTDPDILLIDEVLAVGDAAFIHRCHDTISEFRRMGKTMLFVTHDLDSVARWCDEAIWLNKGNIVARGEPRKVIDKYLLAVERDEEQKLEEENSSRAEQSTQPVDDSSVIVGESVPTESQEEGSRWGNGQVEITSVRMLDAAGEPRWIFHVEEPVIIEVNYEVKELLPELVFGIGVLRVDGLQVYGTNTQIEGLTVPLPDQTEFTEPGVRGSYRVTIERLGLLEHSYYLDVAAHNSEGVPFDYHHRMYKFSVRNPTRAHGVFEPVHQWNFTPEYVVERACA